MKESDGLSRPDAEIVGSVQNGDHSVFAELVKRYERSVRSVALGVLNNDHDAEDALQEAFVAAYRAIGSLRNRSSFGAWMLKIARREALAVAKRRATTILHQPESRFQARHNGNLDDEMRLLLAALARLPPHERVSVHLRYFEGHAVKEIAALTGRPVGTVTKQISRAVKRLRTMLERDSETTRH